MYTHEELREAQALAARLVRAEALAKAGVTAIEPVGDSYVVTSQDGLRKYLVRPNGVCTCPDWEYRFDLHHGRCKHRMAVLVYEESLREAAARQARRRRRAEERAGAAA